MLGRQVSFWDRFMASVMLVSGWVIWLNQKISVHVFFKCWVMLGHFWGGFTYSTNISSKVLWPRLNPRESNLQASTKILHMDFSPHKSTKTNCFWDRMFMFVGLGQNPILPSLKISRRVLGFWSIPFRKFFNSSSETWKCIGNEGNHSQHEIWGFLPSLQPKTAFTRISRFFQEKGGNKDMT